MVIFFEEKDLISFGNFMLSEQRSKQYIEDTKLSSSECEEQLKQVNDKDILLWSYLINKQSNE